MPTVLRHQGYRFYFYSHEPNEPPHIHVDKGEKSAKLWLSPVAFARNIGYNAGELGSILDIVKVQRQNFLEAWHEHFGT